MSKHDSNPVTLTIIIIGIVLFFLAFFVFPVLTAHYSDLAREEKNAEKSKEYNKKSKIFMWLALGIPFGLFGIFVLSMIFFWIYTII